MKFGGGQFIQEFYTFECKNWAVGKNRKYIFKGEKLLNTKANILYTACWPTWEKFRIMLKE